MRWIVAVLMFTSLAAGQNGPALTIYNQDFAVVRQPVHLDLQQGQTTVRYNEITSELEPDSVVLRDPSGKRKLQILEQNYLSDPLSQQSLLELFEGKSVEFRGHAWRQGRHSARSYCAGWPRYAAIYTNSSAPAVLASGTDWLCTARASDRGEWETATWSAGTSSLPGIAAGYESEANFGLDGGCGRQWSARC